MEHTQHYGKVFRKWIRTKGIGLPWYMKLSLCHVQLTSHLTLSVLARFNILSKSYGIVDESWKGSL